MKNSTLLHGKRNDAMNKSSRKRVTPLALVVFLLAFVGMARADEVTVYDGTTTNNYVPAYVFYFDDFTKSQYVIPANDLAEVNGGTITSVKFYTTGNNMPYTTVSTIDVYLKEVDYTTISDFEAKDDCQVVYTGTMVFEAEGEGGFCLITFDTPFTYYGGNLLVGCENTTDAGWKNIYFYGQNVDGASVSGHNSSSLEEVAPTQRSFIPKTTFYYSDGVPGVNLVTTPDPIDLGYRPNGAWMRPLEVNVFNYGTETTINSVAVTNNSYFQLGLENISVPFTLGHYHGFNVNLSTVGNASGVVNGNLVVNYGDNEVTLFDVSATAYTPVSPDVWEHAQLVSSFPFTATLNANSVPLYDNYRLPPASISDGADAVYKLVFTEDTYLNASVTSGENGKVALYTEDFNGVGGPDFGNSYTRPQIGGNNAPFTAMIGEGTSTFGYFPFYTLYNYSIAENLFLASELEAAGVTTAPMTSLSWYSTNSPGFAQQGITIWMANVDDETLTTTSHVVTGMTKVYTGAMTPEIGWNEFVFNEDTFAWDGYSNILIYCQRNNGEWNSTVYWQATSSMPFNASSYKYQDASAYDPTVAQTMTTSTTRPNIIFKSGNISRNRDTFVYDFETDLQGWINIDNDGDGYGWIVATDLYTGTEGYGANGSDNFAMGYSYAFSSSYDCDDYLVSPQAYTLGYGANLSFYYDQQSNDRPDYMEVCVSTAASPTAADFTPIWNNGGSRRGNGQHRNVEGGFNRLGNWTQVTLDLSAYVGQNIWIAFHHQAYNQFAVLVDDVTINSSGGGTNGTITDLTVTPGTYYLVASSTSDEFTVEINTDNVPCPEFATNPGPTDAAMEVNTSVLLSWNLDSRATEYRLMFGTSYYCEDTLVDWTDELSEHFFVTGLNNNTNYFWRIDQRNGDCPEGVLGQVWGFTTHLNVPLNLYASDFIHEGEELSLYWDAPNDRSLLYYNIYQDGVMIDSTYDTYYTIYGLSYNINPGYNFNITAVYDEGESNFSNTRWVRVTGEGTIEGYVYEQDGVTPIQGVRVEFQGTGQIGGSYWYYNYTDENGHYSLNMIAGTYTGMAICPGYQEAQHGAFTVSYNELTSDINFVMDEVFFPVSEVVAEYFPDANDPNSPYVKVHWMTGNRTVFDFEDSSMQGWTSIDADGDGNGWYVASEIMATGYGYNGSNDCVLSQSWYNGTVLYPDNYFVSPLVALGGSITFYACAQDASYAAEHFGVAVSTTSNTDPNAFTMLNEWTMSAKSASGSTKVMKANSTTENRILGYSRSGNRSQGTWYQFTVDLGAYSGMGYVAIRHFNCSDMFYLDVDDITIDEPAKSAPIRSFSHYRVYRTNAYNNGPYTEDNTVLLADNVTDTLLIDVSWQDAEAGVYKWGVSCVYSGNRGEFYEVPITWGTPVDINRTFTTGEAVQIAPKVTKEIANEPQDRNRDYLQYCTETFSGGVGTGGGAVYWGVRFPAADLAAYAGQILTKVGNFMDVDGDYGWTYSGTYTVSIYQGGSNAPGTLVSVATDYLPGDMAWHDITLTTPVTIDASQDLWLCFYTADISYPMSGCEYVGNNNSDFLSLDGTTWEHSTDYGLNYTWMIRGLIENTGIQLPRESAITWSNFLDKDMFLNNGEVDLSVTLNSGDSPAGTTVRFTNLNAGEQQFYPVADVILDGTGYYVWDSFRKGDYQVTITKDGYETIIDNIGIWDATSLSYIMTDIIYNVSELYVSRTGWVKWNPQGDPSTPSSGGNDSFEFGFENDFEGWTTINNDGDSLNWVNSINSISASGYDYTGLAHGGNYFVYSQSYIDYVGAYNADNYLVSPQKYSITNGSTLSFWADNGNESYPDHFAIAIATADTPGASDFVDVWSHSGAKSESKAATRYAGNRYQNWRLHSVDLSSYAGQDVWIAFHHQDYDMYEIWIDDVTLTTGAKSSGDRHFEYYQVRCENSNHEPIFSINTSHNFCQVATEGLIEGEQYICKVAAVYSSGMSAYKECVWEYEPCDHWGPVDNVVVYANEQGNHIEWMFENGYNPYGSNKSSIGLAPQHSDIWGDGSDYQMLKGGEFYSQYAEDGIMLNFFALDNVDLRAFLLYNFSNDSRFSLVPEDEYGQFVLTSNEANNNFMDEFEMAYQKAIADFSLLSKVDIDDNMVIWKSSVAPTNYLSIMMDVITARTRTENDHCLNSIPFCTSDVISFNAASTSQTADQLEGIALQDGCIGASYNPSWYHMRIHTAGQFIIHMEGHDPTDGSERDVDYCIWGPFTNPYLPCVSDLTTDKIIDCNYSPYYAEDIYMGYPENEHQHQDSHGTMNYHMPEIGEYYIMMITNFSRQPCNITFTKTEGVGETDCDIINTTGIIGFLVTEDGEYVAIAGPDEREYTVEGEFGEHEYCVRPIYPGEMQLPTQNYGWSMGCPQIASIDEENHWNVDIHQYPYNMNVTGIIQINGVEQQTPTLEIGAFCGDECRGTQRLTYFPQVDRYLVFLTLYGDAGDVMSFRLYDHALGQELDLSCSSTITFVPDGFMGNAFDPYVFSFGNTMAEQVSNFSQGYNWWGTYIEQEGIDGLGMLQNGLGDDGVTIRSQASGYTDYYQGYGWYGSLSSINNESSYRVITSAPCTVTMTGNVAVPSQHPITLSQGWTWIGYVPSTTMSVDAALANMDAVQGDKLKSQQGYADYYVGYGWYGSLNTIEPGMGLMYYSTNGNSISFTYPDNGRGGELRQNLTSENNHWKPNIFAYPDNMTVMAVVELDDKELTSDNYELAAFTANGECRGSVKITYAEPLHRHVAFLTISGKDAAELSFRLYDTETGVEYYDAEESLDFVANAIVGDASDLYVVHFRGSIGMDEFASRVKVYPNPVSPGERFSIGMNTDIKSPVRVEIVNALGAIVSVETSTQAPASIVAPITAGVYTLRITVEGKGTAVRKLVVK